MSATNIKLYKSKSQQNIRPGTTPQIVGNQIGIVYHINSLLSTLNFFRHFNEYA